MTAPTIQHTRRVRNYRAPLLLDQRSMLRLGLVFGLFLMMVFLSGYLLGMQKAEARLALPAVERLALALPEPVPLAAEDVEPQVPQQVAPGESIDVDSADAASTANLEIPMAQAAATAATAREKTVIQHLDQAIQAAAGNPATVPSQSSSPDTMGMGGPSASDPGQPADDTQTVMLDNATRDTARYSIQVGMYSQLDNAERRVEELLAADLNAYLEDYINGQNKTRYTVRFGYFADYRSARAALQSFEQEMAGSGYIINLKSTETTL